ncbi:hypothetical protein AVEN_25397-1 [Araneus ventricosus]|uniref:Uncharacterized protein n=1 Tax=Araneus ventricosus TaxID=182803 RepID=A0A4Y2SD19_ARAVE|nr:hypothetical protein AVEN_25397-1 [Araneus ventricosus]
MAGDTLAQASVIQFRSSCNVRGVAAYTRCLMYPPRKKSNRFMSGECGGHSTQPPYPITWCWNVSECTFGHLIPSAEERRRLGTIHSGGHSTANSQRILRPSFSLFFHFMLRYNFGSYEPNKYAFNDFYF